MTEWRSFIIFWTEIQQIFKQFYTSSGIIRKKKSQLLLRDDFLHCPRLLLQVHLVRPVVGLLGVLVDARGELCPYPVPL